MFLVLWQHWLQRPMRFFFTLLSLVLSTATLVGIIVASHNARSSFRDLSNAVQGLPSLDISNAEGGRFDLSSLDASILGRDVVVGMPTLVRGTMFRHQEQKARGLVIGVPMAQNDLPLRTFLQKNLELEERELPGADECIVSMLVASQLKVEVGDSIQCLFRRGNDPPQGRAGLRGATVGRGDLPEEDGRGDGDQRHRGLWNHGATG